MSHWVFSLQRALEAEMKRLKLELKQTMDMYSSACKEAISANNKVMFYVTIFIKQKVSNEWPSLFDRALTI